MRKIDKIIVHCSATAEGKDFTVADIRRWHKERGWKDIGYHFVVYRDGSIHEGRPVTHIGAHCFGHNTSSIGICYIGGLAADGKTPKDTRTLQQVAALRAKIAALKKEYPEARIYGHHNLDRGKACPCFDAYNEYLDL